MQLQGLLSGPKVPSRVACCRHCPLARHAHSLATPSTCALHVCNVSASTGRQRNVQALAASASLEDVSERTSEAVPSSGDQAAASPLDQVELASEAGREYEPLREALRAGDFEKADDITRNELIQLAGAGAVKRGWVYFTEIKFIPVDDMKTLDALWKAGSGNKFGFSVQKEVWMQQSRYWTRFFKKIDWTQGEMNYYRKWPMEFMYSVEEAPKGHLPLTNALRGTQLLQAILEHPAFDKGVGKDNGGKPEWMK